MPMPVPYDDDPYDDPRGSGQLFFSQHLPRDAEVMGLDRNTEEGALVAMAGSLSTAKLAHRVVAWVLLAVFSLPLVLTLLHELS